jgi:hypothetical protein
MSFCLGLLSGSPVIPKIGTPAILKAHNVVCRPLIEVRSEKKVVTLVKSFPTVCGTSPARKEIGAILDF